MTDQNSHNGHENGNDPAIEALLAGIDGPADLHGLDDAELQQVAQEMRTYIIDTIGQIGGHFGANLGTCELAVALHSLLDSPRDKVLWDVGHQSYPHKILTGRRDDLPTIRQYDGLAPFCSIAESEHDIMGAGHASTSIGYAVGLKEAMRKGIGEDGRVAAVIGDGALTGGVAYEALLAAGGLQTPMVVVLNDNGMSISPNVGALSRYFNRIRLNPRLYHAREDLEDRLTRLPLGVGRRIERLGPEVKAAIKAYWAPGLFFEELDLAYMGVIDGHDVKALRRALTEAFEAERPVVVHIHTVKGKGFAPAEENGLASMEEWHAAKPNSIVNGRPTAAEKPVPVQETDSPEGIERLEKPPAPGSPPQYTKVFAEAMVAEAERDERVIGITAAMAGGTGLQKLADERPEQYYDVGIAEQNAVDRPRRLPAGAGRDLRDGSRRPGRRRRPDPPRGLRHLLLPSDPERGPDGSARRGDAGPHAPHRGRPRWAGGAALSARGGRGGRGPRHARAAADRQGRGADGGAWGGAARLRLRGPRGARGGGDPRRPRDPGDRRRCPLRQAARRGPDGEPGARP
jgi:1-deoxy-D-xylulose-5-phosphate synthase